MDSLYDPSLLKEEVSIENFKKYFLKLWEDNERVAKFFELLENEKKSSTLPLTLRFFNSNRVRFVINNKPGKFSCMQAATEMIGRNRALISMSYKGKSKEELLEVLSHEFCHYYQLVDERRGIWHNPKWPDDYKNMEAHEAGDSKIDPEVLKAAYKRIILYEHDCNTRSLKQIKELELPLDIKRTCKRMNAYHLFYYAGFAKQSWYDDFDPADDEDALKVLEDKLTAPSELESFYKNGMFMKCFKKKNSLLKFLNINIVGILTLLVLSWFYSAIPADRKVELAQFEKRAVELSREIYKEDFHEKDFKYGLGKLSIIKEDKIAYFVFKGTEFGVFAKNLNSLPMLLLFMFFGLLCLCAYYSKFKKIKTKRFIFIITSIVTYFVYFNGYGVTTTKYLQTSNELMAGKLKGQGILSFLKKNKIERVVFAGHSKGGAEASLQYEKATRKIENKKIKFNLLTIGSAKAVEEGVGNDVNAKNILFKSDSVQYLNMNYYRGVVKKYGREGLFDFLIYIVFILMLTSLVTYNIHKGVMYIFKKYYNDRPTERFVEITKLITIWLLIPTLYIILILFTTHDSKNYVEYVNRNIIIVEPKGSNI